MTLFLPPISRVAVPPGVGDVYWVLTKLRSIREKHRIRNLTMCVQKTELTRAVSWPEMTTGLVDRAQELTFRHNKLMDTQGHFKVPGSHICLWPNTIVDRGLPLANWLPQYDIDLNFEIKTDDQYADNGAVVYASSEGVNKAWFPGRGLSFWNDVLNRAADMTGQLPTLIGARWDNEFSGKLTAPHRSLLGMTNLPQVAGVLKNARVVIGIISGMTILANHFGTPTVAVYPDFRFPVGFPMSWTRPGIPYIPVGSTKVKEARYLTDAANSLLGTLWTTAQ